MERKMKLWIVLATWSSWSVVFGLGIRVICPLATQKNYTVLDQIPSVAATFIVTSNDETDKNGYKKFLQDLRTSLAPKNPNDKIPILPSTALGSAKFRYVDIIINKQGSSQVYKEIRLGLNVINSYIVAYNIGDNSYFFNDKNELKDAQANLFARTKLNILTAFSGNYIDFEHNGGGRLKTELGIVKLKGYVEKLHEKTNPKDIAMPLVAIIQMVAEAARFKYIEDKITSVVGHSGSFKPKTDVTTRENNWEKLSEGIQFADQQGFLRKKTIVKNPNTQKVEVRFDKTEIQLANEKGLVKKITKVSEIQGEMGLLKYANPNLPKKYSVPSYGPTTFQDQINLLLPALV